MINNISDLELKNEDTLDHLDAKLKDKLGIDISTMVSLLSTFVIDKAPELAGDFINIIPYGEYDKMIEESADITKFLAEEASKPDNWSLYAITPSNVNSELIQFIFNNSSIDEGDLFQGHVFVNKSGKVRHVFTQVS